MMLSTIRHWRRRSKRTKRMSEMGNEKMVMMILTLVMIRKAANGSKNIHFLDQDGQEEKDMTNSLAHKNLS